MIEDVENFKSDLGIEVLGNSFEIIVFEQRRIKIYQARPSQDVSPHVAAEIVTLRFGALSGIAIRRIKSVGWRRWYPEAPGFDIVVGIPWIDRCVASRTR